MTDQPTDNTPGEGLQPLPPAPENPGAKLQEFLGKLMTDMSRMRASTDFFARHTTGEFNRVGERLDHLERCLQILFNTMHMEMPQPLPQLLDAQVELVAIDDLPADETCELRIMYTSQPHPVYGNYQVLVGAGEATEVRPITSLHPIIVERIAAAFGKARVDETLKEGSFYYVRLGLIHSRPVNESSVPYDPSVPAANDEFPETPDAPAE